MELLSAATMAGWWDAVLSTSLAAGLVLLAILALDVLLSRKVSARWRAALYLAVAARVLLPVEWTSPLGLAEGAAPGAIAAESVASADALPEAERAAPVASAAEPVVRAWPRAFMLHGGVSLALVLAWGLARAALGRRLRSAGEASERVKRLAPEGVAVQEHAALGPAVFGILRPRIVIPSELARELGDDALSAVLRHEAAHVGRRDPVLLALIQVFTFLAWPILPAWVAAWRVRGLMEQACDEAALRGRSGGERRAYGEALIRVAEWQPLRARLALGMLAFGGGLVPRLRQLRFTRRWPAFAQAALVAAGAILVVLASGARQATAEAVISVDLDHRVFWGMPATLLDAAPDGVIVTGKGGMRVQAGSMPLDAVRRALAKEAREQVSGALHVPVGIGYESHYPLPGTTDSLTLRFEPLPSGVEVSWETPDGTFSVPLSFDGGRAAVITITSPRSSEPMHVVLSTPEDLPPGPQPRSSPSGGIEIARSILERHCSGAVEKRGDGDALEIQGTCPSPVDLANMLRDLEERFDFADVALERMAQSSEGKTVFVVTGRWNPAIPVIVEITSWRVTPADVERLLPSPPGVPWFGLADADAAFVRIQGSMGPELLTELRVQLAMLLQEGRATPIGQEALATTAGVAVRAPAGELGPRRGLELSVIPRMGLRGFEASVEARWSTGSTQGASSLPAMGAFGLGEGDVVLAIIEARRAGN